MAAMPQSALLVLLLLGGGLASGEKFSGTIKGQSAKTFDDAKCSACTTIVQELSFAMELEKPSQDLDLLTRLDSKGQRQGKVVDWEMSELRALELQEGLCDKMYEYRIDNDAKLEKLAGGAEGAKKLRMLGGGQDKPTSDKLFGFCSGLLEDHEDIVLRAIRGKEEGDPMLTLAEEMCVARSHACESAAVIPKFKTIAEAESEADAKKNKKDKAKAKASAKKKKSSSKKKKNKNKKKGEDL
jgi:hypothetical protein